MGKNKVLLGPSSFAELDEAPLKLLQDNEFEVVDNPFKRKLTKSELFELLHDKDITGLIAGLEPLDREVLEKSNLKVISRCGSGMSNVDQEAAKKLNIKVFSTPFGPTNAVAELTLTCLLSLLRELPQINNSMHKRKWDKRIGSELRDKKAVIIGFGRIGQRVGHLISCFGAEVIAVDPAYESSDSTIKSFELHEALKIADIITLHSSGTTTILGDKEFDMMKDGVYILNSGRGELIDEASLINALDKGKVKGAWIDTFTQEPYSGLLCDYDQVILTSHIGSYTVDCRRNMEYEAVENLIKGFNKG